MNHVFKIIWNKVNQCGVAVSELSKSVGKSSQTDKRKALNVIIGAAVLAGATTSAMAETNVVVNDKGTVIGGTGAVADRTNAVVLGNSANSNTADSIAIGTGAKVEGNADYNQYNIAIGNKARSTNKETVAIGNNANGWGSGGIAIGSGSNAPFRGTAVGYGTKASDEGWATAIGNESNASGRGAIAMGNGAKSSGNDAIALGFITNASGENAVTIGVRSFATGKSASAYGSNTKASGDYSTAIGVVANTTGYSSTALGHRAKAEGHGSTALGSYSWSKGGGSAALGYLARAIGSTSIAIGPISTSSAEDAIALGVGANASGMSSIAIGESTKAEGYNSVALGSDSTNTHENSVALGSSSAGAKNVFNDAATKLESFDDGANSKTINYNGTSSYKTIINYGYSFTKESTGAVSVGDGSLVRQIQNVGAGRITATSNDAVNGSQLYQAYYNAGFNIQNNGTETSRINTHGKVNFVNGENTEVVVKDGENAAEIKVNAKDTSASVEAGSDAITVTVGEPTKVTGKDGVTVTTVTNYKVDLSQKTKDEIKNAGGRGFNVTASASEGTVVNEVTEETVQSTATKMDKLTLDAGKNIKLTHKKGKVLSVAVSDTPTFTNVTTTGDLNVGGTVHAHGGLDVHNNRIVNVADPKDPTDAVNKRYVDNKIDHVDRKLRAGIAGATAISFLQRPNEAGKSLVSVGVSGYRNENALAVGYGRNSDNNKVSIKVGASINSRSDVNWGGSIGYQW
ncbi:YadA-like family protein [Haemophilus parainfluenzae]|uniref:YadA-like family protein n=1 Tax=Haemophilus parainfluenzae TaxID=729 RepID=UPI000FFE4AB1|nr:YadA-like family protein [Haemophilus parainfluenzae]KAB1991996.1 hypothetical protein F8M38_05175 [Haemophilus parainfluenzae]QAT95363.1 hypothetical protein ERO09_05015 [Haemophilus parainfluenzae]